MSVRSNRIYLSAVVSASRVLWKLYSLLLQLAHATKSPQDC